MPTVAENPPTIIEAGIDYITLVATDYVKRAPLAAAARRLLESQAESGCDVMPWRFSGYRGWFGGSISYGVRDDSVCVRISSILADENWLEFYPLATNITRLDLQVTVSYGFEVSPLILKLRNQVHRATTGRGRKPNYHLHVERHGPTSINIGRRSSDIYLRCYDKGRESQLPYYSNCLRYEAELKRNQALCYGQSLSLSSSRPADVRSYVVTLFSDRGALPLLPHTYSDLSRRPTQVTTTRDERAQALTRSERYISACLHRGEPELAHSYVESLGSYLKSMLNSQREARQRRLAREAFNGDDTSDN